jgi:kinesin family protein 5
MPSVLEATGIYRDKGNSNFSLFVLSLQQKSPDGSSKQGKLNLVDLAGSEKVGKTGASGETLEEVFCLFELN